MNPLGTKQNLNLLLDDHVKKETKERPGPDRMLTEVEEESLTNYLAYSEARFPNDPCYGEEVCY